jgi:SAM-dependent methyltransferase
VSPRRFNNAATDWTPACGNPGSPDPSALPLPDGGVDVVLACLAIHNIHDPGLSRQTIDEAARVLRPGVPVLGHQFCPYRQ